MYNKLYVQKAQRFTIEPKSNLFSVNLMELWNYRYLILLFVKRDFVSFYKQTILGPIWYFIQPLLTTAIFIVIFNKLAGLSTDTIPPILFYLAGLTNWNFFAECINKTSSTFINNANIYGKVYFPRLIIPFSVIISNLINFCIQLLLFASILAYYYLSGTEIYFSAKILLIPIITLNIGILGLGTGIIISSLTTKYRDLRFLVTFGIQLLMYATPIIYPLSAMPDKYHLYFKINPMTNLVETFRDIFFGTNLIDWNGLAYSLISSFLLLFFGMIVFNKVEKSFMDTV